MCMRGARFARFQFLCPRQMSLIAIRRRTANDVLSLPFVSVYGVLVLDIPQIFITSSPTKASKVVISSSAVVSTHG